MTTRAPQPLLALPLRRQRAKGLESESAKVAKAKYSECCLLFRVLLCFPHKGLSDGPTKVTFVLPLASSNYFAGPPKTGEEKSKAGKK